MKMLFLNLQVDMTPIDASTTQRVILRDVDGHTEEFWFMQSLGEWVPLICELSLPSNAFGDLDLQKITKIQIQIRNWNKLTIPYLAFWVDHLGLCEDVTFIMDFH
jgi:hypothetical protein